MFLLSAVCKYLPIKWKLMCLVVINVVDVILPHSLVLFLFLSLACSHSPFDSFCPLVQRFIVPLEMQKGEKMCMN